MAYHIHPLTGQAHPCRAKKRCPFGDLTTEHYATREEAQAAYEASWRELPPVRESYGTPLHLRVAVEEAGKQVAALEDPALRALGQSLLTRLASWQGEKAFGDALAVLEEKTSPGEGATRHLLGYFRQVAAVVAEDASQEDLERHLRQEEKEAAYYEKRAEELRAQGFGEDHPGLRTCLKLQEQARALALRERERLSPQGPAWQEEMRRGYEKLRTGLSRLTLSPQPRGDLSEPLFRGEAFELYYVDDEAVLRGKLAPELCYHGRPSPGDYREALAGATTVAETFLQGVEEEDYFPAPRSYAADEEGTDYYDTPPSLEARGFRYLGRGVEQVAYLHEESGLVVKLPLPTSHLPLGVKPLEQEEVQQRYALVNTEGLAAHDAEYVPTYFLSLRDGAGAPVSVVVQPYLPPGEYIPAKASYLTYEQGLGVADTHQGNVRRSLATGKLVLFDCLY